MREISFTAIALSLFFVGCYQGEASQEDLVGFAIPLGETGLSMDAQAIERWMNWTPSGEGEGVEVFSWDVQDQNFFAGIAVSCRDSATQQESALLLQSLAWRSIGPVGAEVLVLVPFFDWDPSSGVTSPCHARLVVRSLASDGHGTMILSEIEGLEKGAWESELLQMEVEAPMTGQVEIEGAGDAELRLNVPSCALTLQPEIGAAGSQLYYSLPLREELVLEQFDGWGPEWTPMMTFELSDEGERLTISLP